MTSAAPPIGPLAPPKASSRRTFANNTLGLISSGFAARLIALAASLYVRRVLGARAIGQIAWVLAVSTYFSLVINPGLETIAKREVAKDRNTAAYYLSLLLSVQLVLAIVSLLVLIGLAVAGIRGPEIRWLLILQGLGLLFLPITVTWLLHASERMVAGAVVEVIGQFLWLPLAFSFIRTPHDIYRAVWLPYIPRAIVVLFVVWYIRRLGLINWRSVRLTLNGAGPLLREAIPISVSQVAILIYCNVDAILLGFLGGDEVVGMYTTAYSLMFYGMIISGSLNAAVFPALTRTAIDPARAAVLSRRVLLIFVWSGCALAALGWGAGRHLLTLLYGSAFAPAGPWFEWLSVDLALIFFNMGMSQPFNAWGQQRAILKITVVGAIVNLGLNLIVLPVYGAPGAIATTLASETCVSICCILARRRIVPFGWAGIVAAPLVASLAVALSLRCITEASPRYWWVWSGISAMILGMAALVGIHKMTSPASPENGERSATRGL